MDLGYKDVLDILPFTGFAMSVNDAIPHMVSGDYLTGVGMIGLGMVAPLKVFSKGFKGYKNYKKRYNQAKGSNIEPNSQIHHSYPQKYRRTSEMNNYDIDDPIRTFAIISKPGRNSNIHSHITNEFGRWDKKIRQRFGQAPSHRQILQKKNQTKWIKNMDNFMTDICINEIVYFLDIKKINLYANVTDTYFKEIPNSPFQIQKSDLNVEIEQSYIEQTIGLIPLDCGGIAVTTNLKNCIVDFIGNKEIVFRKMTVNGQHDILWQICISGTYNILNNNLINDNSIYRGPIEASSLEISKVSSLPIGCLIGREDYQECIFSKKLYEFLCNKYDIADLFIKLPLYNKELKNIVDEKFDIVDNFYFDNIKHEYINILRGQELLALLKFAKYKNDLEMEAQIYKVIKTSNLSFNIKKDAMMIKNKGK